MERNIIVESFDVATATQFNSFISETAVISLSAKKVESGTIGLAFSATQTAFPWRYVILHVSPQTFFIDWSKSGTPSGDLALTIAERLLSGCHPMTPRFVPNTMPIFSYIN